MWTMVFDTGLEVRAGDRSYFSHFHFSELENASPPAKDGDNFQDIGQYLGRKGKFLAPMGKTYACHCDVLSTGFWHKKDPKTGNVMEYGCLWGAKKDSIAVDGSLKNSPNAIVHLRQALPKPSPFRSRSSHSNASAPAMSFALHSVADLDDDGFRYHGTVFKDVYPVRAPAPSAAASVIAPVSPGRTASMERKLPQRVSLRGVEAHTTSQGSAKMHDNTTSGATIAVQELPANFDWRIELQDMVAPGQDPLGEQVDQGPCGSCYAFAGVLMLQMRFRVQLFKKHQLLYPLELSYKSAARCSPYTEGCNGGFSYLTMRLAEEVGVPEEKCDHGVSAGSLDETCDWKCYGGNNNLFFAKDYWHVGGFSHGSDEESIMREIYENGPVELGFSTKAIPEFVARSGQSVSNSTNTMTIIVNDRAPKEPFSTNSEVQPWTFSTHAILGVGWGEESVNWGMVKYWIVRNSWGRDWGNNGYAYMRRGNNDGGIETDATMVIPDFDRLPQNFLEEAKKYHEQKASERAMWKTARSSNTKAETVDVAPKGKPKYCEDRPDSIDCQ
jgi:hypothetical protein